MLLNVPCEQFREVVQEGCSGIGGNGRDGRHDLTIVVNTARSAAASWSSMRKVMPSRGTSWMHLSLSTTADLGGRVQTLQMTALRPRGRIDDAVDDRRLT